MSSNTKALLSSNHILCVDAKMCYVLEEPPNVENQSTNLMLVLWNVVVVVVVVMLYSWMLILRLFRIAFVSLWQF